MTVKRPNLEQLRAVAEDLGMNMSQEDLESYSALMQPNFAAYDVVEAMPDYLPEVKYPRTPGYQPEGEENKYNAWYVKTTIKGAQGGKLAGKTIAIKDNVCVAGVPMMNGASTLEGYVPDTDATIVTRILDAGGTILGKTHCEYFCFSGGSHTRRQGSRPQSASNGLFRRRLVFGQRRRGGDRRGRHGDRRRPGRLDPHACVFLRHLRHEGDARPGSLYRRHADRDHARSHRADDQQCARQRAAAGSSRRRRRARSRGNTRPRSAEYTKALDGGVRGLRIGIVKEGFGLPNSEGDVDAKVMAGAKLFGKLGATVDEISVPMHLLGPAIWLPIAAEGATELMMKGNGMGTNWRGLYTTSLLDAHSAWKHRADELSDSLKITMLLGQYFTKHYRGHFYAKAQNLSRKLRAAYDAALANYDLLLMPTLPVKATPLPPADAPRSLYLQRAFEMIPNTAPFDVTGHPAMTLPCGMSDGLPVGLMLIGKHFDESTIYRAAAAFEGGADWKKM